MSEELIRSRLTPDYFKRKLDEASRLPEGSENRSAMEWQIVDEFDWAVREGIGFEQAISERMEALRTRLGDRVTLEDLGLA